MPLEEPAPASLRIAVVGCGDISAQHFAAIETIDGATLAAVVDVDPGRRDAAAAAHGVPGHASLGELLAQGGIDVVHVCTPHDAHAPLAREALAAGVHVLTEKPVAHTLADAEALAVAAREAFRGPGTQLGVCFQNRYNTPVRALQELLARGGLGRIVGATATVMWHRTPDYYAARPWRGTWAGSGGGLLMNQAIHTLDLLEWLVGPARVVGGAASTRALAGAIEVEDTADILLEHTTADGGTLRSVFFATNANAVNSPVTLDITTERAELSLRGALTVRHGDGRVDIVHEEGILPGERSYWGASHRLLIEDFYASIGSDRPFWIGAEEACAPLRIIKDVYARTYAPGEWV
ncbi:Gfo/Idh/MocA family oxidoreductase [Sinomonas sp. JGH33]|uniref:Gfo/Idh/MocA family oxidoreductase n=1 Tax=Sinomonas terricola TaxID=3110330 RepID=A0ABU5T6H5_9MICC|nr:Gfo/Idh/MocA family oxidoreductase [Sinomonas sp. JGH33]MEA5455096.1 Gfo/Idh/MocA family oxidoreductase [Sinomonas sp. JGH33]